MVKVIPPVGREFDHWEIGGNPVTGITTTDLDAKTVVAKYRNLHYPIHWDTRGAIVNIATESEYEYSVGYALLSSYYVTLPAGESWGYWTVNGVEANSITNTQAGAANVILVFAGAQRQTITWDLTGAGGVGSIIPDYVQGTSYTVGIEVPLPTNKQVILPTGYSFDYWNIIDGGTGTVIRTNATRIESTFDVDVIVRAIYRFNTPQPGPTPAPYYPSRGGGGGSSGGSSIVGPLNQSAKKTIVSTTKDIKEIIDSSTCVWNYDPRNDTWQLSANNVAGQNVNINNGFYMVSNILTVPVNKQALDKVVNIIYYFDALGNMITGFIETPDGKIYFMENQNTANEGMMVFGWIKINNKWYYFNSEGAMLKLAQTSDGYFVGADGVWIQS